MDFIEDIQRGKDECFIGFDDLSIHDHLIKDVMSLLDIVHDVQLANVLEVFIHSLDQIVNEFEVGHFVLNQYESTYSSRSRPTMK